MSLSSVLKPAWRSLRRSPAFTVTASLTLIIGIGAAVAIFALVNGVLLRPLPYGDPDRLVVPYHSMQLVGLGIRPRHVLHVQKLAQSRTSACTSAVR
jgi:hypothetical protein